MKKLISIILLISCFASYNNATCQEFKNDELTITKLENNMWVLETNTNSTMYLIEGSEKAMLVDAGLRVKNFDSIIKKITKKPVVVLITHGHGDHTGNISYFKEIWMHSSDAFMIGGYKGKINFVKEGDVFDLGGTKLEVSEMPAHTPGSFVLIDKKAGNCYSGDAFGANHVWLQLKPLSPMQTYVNSCKKMEALIDSGITKVYCGHYCYIKKPYDKSYITAMRELAEGLINGTGPEAKPYEQKTGCANPMCVEKDGATLVFDPDYLKQSKN